MQVMYSIMIVKDNLVTKSDRVLKSLPNQFDYFPEE